MVEILICDNKYNRLPFWFEDMNQAVDLIQLALREGYEVKITTTKKDGEGVIDI